MEQQTTRKQKEIKLIAIAIPAKSINGLHATKDFTSSAKYDMISFSISLASFKAAEESNMVSSAPNVSDLSSMLDQKKSIILLQTAGPGNNSCGNCQDKNQPRSPEQHKSVALRAEQQLARSWLQLYPKLKLEKRNERFSRQ